MITLKTNILDNVPPIKVFDCNDNFLGETNNIIVLDDFRRQIKQAQATGYYLIDVDGNKITIDRNGTLSDYSGEIFDVYTNILIDLI